MRYFIGTLLFLFLMGPLCASSIHWVGGVGKWNNPANWNLNKVPKGGDIVYITGNSSQVHILEGVQAQAGQIFVFDQATLVVDGQLSLVEIGLVAMINEGYIYLNGQLDISDDPDDFNKGYRGRGNSLLEIAPQAEMNIIGIRGGVTLFGNAMINLRGHMNLQEMTGQAFSLFAQSQVLIEEGGQLYFADVFQGLFIRAQNTFTNNGEVIFEEDIVGTPITIFGGTLINNHSGTIAVLDSGSQSINNSGMIHNFGHLYVKTPSPFYNTGGSLVNEDGAKLTMVNSGNLVANSSSMLIQNYGLIDIKNANDKAIALINQATLENHSSGKIQIEGINTNQGIHIDSGGKMANEGFVEINVPNHIAIFMINSASEYHNQACSRTDILGGYIHIQNTGTFINDSGLSLQDPWANHIISNTTFINNGVIGDRFTTMAGLDYDNQGLVTQPIPGPLVFHQIVSDVFILGSSANLSTPTMRKTPNGALAGSYILIYNKYIPNIGGVGADELWLGISINGCETDWFMTPVDNSTPLVGQTNANLNFSGNQPTEQIFPNPAMESIQVTHGLAQEGDIQLGLWTPDGQLISQQNYEAFPGESLRFSRPSGLPNGSYLIRLISQDQAPTTLRIIWQ